MVIPRILEAVSFSETLVSSTLHGVTSQKTLVPNSHRREHIRGHAVALLVQTLCYKSEGRGFDSL
jgi:hypothetical protein